MHSFKHNTAFFSCADKTGIPDLAKDLSGRGWKLFSAGGTCKAISDAGVPVSDIAKLPGSVGEMLDHRLLTLQACAHGPLLTDGGTAHSHELARHGFPAIFELIIIDPYPFESAVQALKQGSKTVQQVWEMIDVGGPAMLKSAIKGLKFPVVTADRRNGLIEWIDLGCPNFSLRHREALCEAMHVVASRENEHLSFLAQYLSAVLD